MDALPGVGLRLFDTFDMGTGEGWRHEIEVERIDPAPSGALHFVCLGGERSAPPDVFTSPAAYRYFLETGIIPPDAETRATPDEDDTSDADGVRVESLDDFDPNAFSAAEVNLRASVRILKVLDPKTLDRSVRDMLMNVAD